MYIKKKDKITDKTDDKITHKNDNILSCRNVNKRQKLLSDIIGGFFDSAEKNNLDNEKVNKVVKGVQYLFQKDPKQRDIRCFTCEKD